MSKNILTDLMQEYMEDITPEPQGELKDLQEEALAKEIPIIESEVGQFLSLLISIQQPQRILELGTGTGYSTLWLAQGNRAQIVTIELKEREAKVARKNFEKLGLSDRVQLLVGDALELMDNLEQSFDLVFIDAAKGQYLEYLEKALEITKQRGLIVADNILFKGMISSDELMHPRYDTLVYRLREYITKVTTDPALQSSILPLGDGLAISLKLEEGS